MKALMTLTILSLFVSSFAMANTGQTKTDCPYMREDDSRSNPKSDLESKKPAAIKSSVRVIKG